MAAPTDSTKWVGWLVGWGLNSLLYGLIPRCGIPRYTSTSLISGFERPAKAIGWRCLPQRPGDTTAPSEPKPARSLFGGCSQGGKAGSGGVLTVKDE